MILVTVGVLVLLTVTGKTGGVIVTVPPTRSPAPRALLPATVYVVVVPVGATLQAGPPVLSQIGAVTTQVGPTVPAQVPPVQL